MKLEVQVQVSSYLEKIFQVFSSQTRKVLETSSIFVPSNFEFVALIGGMKTHKAFLQMAKELDWKSGHNEFCSVPTPRSVPDWDLFM